MKRIRLSDEAYLSGHAFSVTIATAGRDHVFATAPPAERCLELLEETTLKFQAKVFAYCLMPDHIHLLVWLPEEASLLTFVKHFKQITSYHVRRLLGRPGSVWQTRFYDHALRREEDLHGVAAYIFHNPVRAGIVTEPSLYPYSGSYTSPAVLSSGPEGSDLRAQAKASPSVGGNLQVPAKNAP